MTVKIIHDITAQVIDVWLTKKISDSEYNEIRNFLWDLEKPNKMMPFEFVKWYSGMEEQKILNAFERYKKELEGMK